MTVRELDSSVIRDLATDCDFDMVGVAAPTKVDLPPELDWCQSVILLGYATPDDTLDICFRVERDGHKKWSKWIYEILDARAALLCTTLADHGYRAFATRSGDLIDLKKAAVLAGLGTLGRNNLLITDRFGPRVRLIAILTDALFEFDERAANDVCVDCDLCLAACPLGALTVDGFDKHKCVGGRGGFGQPQMVLEQQKLVERWISDLTFIQCISCMVACPVGDF